MFLVCWFKVDEVKEVGLVNYIVLDVDLNKVVLEYCEKIVICLCFGVVEMKWLVCEGVDFGIDQQMWFECDVVVCVLFSDDVVEGFDVFENWCVFRFKV